MTRRPRDAIWRGTGYNGIYLLGEGDYNRVKRAMDRQEQRIKGVTAGSEIPVYRMYVGTGANQTRLKDVRKTLLKFKSYQPTHHKNKLMAAIHPRTRFVLTKTELTGAQRASAHSAAEERHERAEGRRPDASAARQPSRHARPLTVIAPA